MSLSEMRDHPLMAGTMYRLVARHGLDPNLANDMVDGLCQFLVVLAEQRRVLSPPTLIDTAWHEALIDTTNYAEYCESYFGVFLHHHPPVSAADNAPENFALTSATVDLARETFGSELVATVWRRSKRLQAVSQSGL